MKNQNIIVLGSRGMLGQMVVEYFGNLNYHIFEFNERIDELNIFRIIQQLNELEDSVVINCIGKIKQKSSDAFTLLWSNAILPLELNRSLKKGHILIQPSTDCVFTGNKRSNYMVSDFNDAQDVYGWSKSLGETTLQHRPNTLIVRVSIIGPDEQSDKGLLSWFLNLKEGSHIKGYTNHIWNGITTLAWCIFIEDYLRSPSKTSYELNTVQLGTTEVHNKYDMLVMFNEIFGKQINIEPVVEGEVISKCLNPDIICKDLRSQLTDLRDFLINRK